VRRHAGDGEDPLRRPARTALARLPVPPPGRLELSLLGPVELRRDGELVDGPDWRRERVRSLLAHLVLHRTVRRERLAADLWPTLDAESQSHNLRVNLVHLLRVLEPDRAERDASFLVRSHGENLVVHPDEWLRTDLWQFDQLWQRASEADAKGSPSAALDALQQAVALWRGDPAELANNEWALPEVEERRLVLVRMVTRAGELLLARGEADAARHMGEQALLVDPWCESAYRLVVVAHVAMGELRSAGSVLERYRIALGELGLPTATASDQLERLTRLVHERSNQS
jgi:LuxR family maltose regulon positive regulatory protein